MTAGDAEVRGLNNHRTKLLFCLALGALALVNWLAFRSAPQPPLAPGELTPHDFDIGRQESARTAMRSLVYLPDGYDRSSPKTRWPLVLFLHGSWNRGDDLELVRATGLPRLISDGRKYPFILVAPQCPAEEVWHIDDLERLITAAEVEFRVDRERIHVTGFELGGYAAWDLAAAHPDRFATIVPFGGVPTDRSKRTSPEWMNRAHLWSFVSSNDRSTNLAATRAPIFRTWERGDYVRLTDVLGDERPLEKIWTAVYENADVVSWMLTKQSKSSLYIRWRDRPTPGQQVRGEVCHADHEGDGNNARGLSFLLYLPPPFDHHGHLTPPPLILWLQHNRSVEANTLAPGQVSSLLDVIAAGAGPRAVVVVPDLAANMPVDPVDVEQLVEQLDVEVSFNPNRCFLLGVDEGARLAWDLAAHDPWRFAAMALVGYHPRSAHNRQANSMAQIPKWFIAGDASTKKAFDYCLLVSKTSNLTGPRPAPKWQGASIDSAVVALDLRVDDGTLMHWFSRQGTTQWSTRRNIWPTNVPSLDMMASPEIAALFKEHEFTPAGKLSEEGSFHYRLFVPSSAPPKQGYPLIVWLHGHGTGEFRLEAGELKYMDLLMRPPARSDRYDFCVLALQCPREQSWTNGGPKSADIGTRNEPISALMQILEQVREQQLIDSNRISIIGISSGAGACWELARRHPDFFSAVAPLGSQGVDLSQTESMRGSRIWAFKGLNDQGADALRQRVQYARQLGADVRLTEVPTPSHYAWTEAFLEHDLLRWLLSQRR